MMLRGQSDDAKAGLYCTFRLAGRLFGVNVLDVKEISAATTFTTIPHAPPEVCGYVSLRGQIHLLLDLRQMLGLERAELTHASRLVLFKPSIGDAFGVLVDTVGDIIRLGGDQIEPRAPADGQEGGDLLAGVGELEDELVILLEPRRFLPGLQRPRRTQPHGALTFPDRR
jgi:purine-binding chemotaxis protein CheW